MNMTEARAAEMLALSAESQMKALKKYRWPLTGALLGVLVFLAVYGVRVLDPTSVDWILNSLSPDPIQHYLGWELFRRSSCT